MAEADSRRGKENVVGNEPKSSAQCESRIRTKNRRKIYLDRHPSYFMSHDLELADPLLFDRCIRRFMSAEDREADGRLKGYSGVLEADLYRSEARLAAITKKRESEHEHDNHNAPDEAEEIPADKEAGMTMWKDEMTLRFLEGRDIDFSYWEVDENDDLDVIENQKAEDRWFEDEEPQWVDNEKEKRGETGIQDF